MMQAITPPIWLSIKPETRNKLRQDLGIPRTGGTEVWGNRIVSDGTTQQDLNTITVQKLQDYLDYAESDDLLNLLDLAVRSIENELEDKPEEVPQEPEKFYCELCDRNFKNEIGLRLHRGKQHKESKTILHSTVIPS